MLDIGDITKQFKISGNYVGSDRPAVIIAEAGINHDGKFEQALELIDIASYCGADVVKFQLFQAKKMYTPLAGNYITANGSNERIYTLLKSVEMPHKWIPELIAHCSKKNVGFLCTVCDEESGDILESYGVDSFKIASYGITHIPLLKYLSKKKKPIIISSGGATLSEVDDAIRTIRDTGNTKIVLLHCIAKYPAPLSSCNMNILTTYQKAFPNIVIGYSDHTEHPTQAPVAAVALGAKIIEKHFTLDKKLPGADHCFAVDPDGLEKMVRAIRLTESKMNSGEFVDVNPVLLGTSEKKVVDIEKGLRQYAFRCMFAIKDIHKNERISIDNSAILRPGESDRGIEPYFYDGILASNAKANKDIDAGKPIKWTDILNI